LGATRSGRIGSWFLVEGPPATSRVGAAVAGLWLARQRAGYSGISGIMGMGFRGGTRELCGSATEFALLGQLAGMNAALQDLLSGGLRVFG
jgi:hypothetical protein